MDLFSHYIQPITSWLHVHPYWALFFTFIISFGESLAIVGSLIPGSVTMTGIGILVGSGIMRLDLTLIAATLGAIGGDSVSYLLGYLFRDRLIDFWPFRNYPGLITYGKSYFARHGGKSVLIGRFVGPLRSIIPLIAGMLHMSHWHFFTANVISGITWSLLYVLPGVLIGSAGSELSPESASRLFAFILIFLVCLWLLGTLIKWCIIKVNIFFRRQFHDLVSWSGKHPLLAKIMQRLNYLEKDSPYQTIGLLLSFFISALSFLVLTILISQKLFANFDHSVYLFLQSLRNEALDVFFITVAEFSGPITLSALFLFVLIVTLFNRRWRSFLYWMGVHLTGALILVALYSILNNKSPDISFYTQIGNSYPAISLTFTSLQFFTLLLYLHHRGKSRWAMKILTVLMLGVLLLSGIGEIYLGDYWLTDILGAYLCGLSLALGYWIFYRYDLSLAIKKYFSLYIIIVLLLSSLLSLYINYDLEKRTHHPYLIQYVFSDDTWWAQKKPLLPLYRTNRIGKPVSIFNIQYAGSLATIERALSDYGWHIEKESLVRSLLKRMNGQLFSQDSPLMAQLYLNRRPSLIMLYRPKNGEPAQILRLWRSNFHLKHLQQPIWLGTITPYNPPQFQYILKALPLFQLRSIPIKIKLPANPSSYTQILLIKEQP